MLGKYHHCINEETPVAQEPDKSGNRGEGHSYHESVCTSLEKQRNCFFLTCSLPTQRFQGFNHLTVTKHKAWRDNGLH